jgi:hypothetical protein
MGWDHPAVLLCVVNHPEVAVMMPAAAAAAAGAVDMPQGEGDWMTDPHQGGLQGWWARSTGPGGSYVIPAVLLTGVALTGVAAFVFMRRRRML